MTTNYINNPISIDGTTMYIDSKIQAAGGGGGGSSTTGTAFGTAATGSVGIGTSTQQLNLYGSTVSVNGSSLPNLPTENSFGSSATSLVQVGNNSSGLKMGTSLTPSGAASGYTAISETGKDVYIQGVKNPITISGALTDETTQIGSLANYGSGYTSSNVNTTNPNFSFRTPFPFTITNPPVFYVKTIGTAGTITFDVLVNGVSIYTAGNRPAIAYVASPTSIQYTTRGTQTGNRAGTLDPTKTTVSQYDLVRLAIYSTSGTSGSWTGIKCFINLS